MIEWKVERLAAFHDRSSFACGHVSLDVWLRQYATQHEKRDLARTYVLVRADQAQVAGYYAISTHLIARQIVPAKTSGKLPREVDIPAILLGRLAVDASYQGEGLGGLLMVDVLRRVQHLADRVGIVAVVVDALDDKARAFYLHYQFIPLLDDPLHLFLPVATIRKLGLEPLAD